MSLKQVVKKELKKRLKDIADIDTQLELDIPRYEHGDFALNIAFKLAKIKKKPPNEIAKELSENINLNEPSIKTTTAGGFINITLDTETLYSFFTTFLNNEPISENKDTILLEYVSANPTGPLHIGAWPLGSNWGYVISIT